ncbi:MAG TPA: hypothetical protein VFB12_29885, partial [Ktedonobacteraceae bacterium]|nr:hypothetical protein [Ktedonobacteraceae bacterium]
FTASDGGTDPPDQQLTVSNPGTRPLYWSFGASTPTVSVNQDMSVLSDMNWLSTKPTSGMVAPGATEKVSITVHSHVLLPGIYTGMLMFTAGQDALNNPQAVAVSLIVLPHCSVATSMQSVSFTVVAGQDKPDTQTLGLSMQSSCTGSITWQAFSSANWLVISPSRGKVEERRDAAMTISVKSSSLQPGTYMTSLVFLTEQHTQTVSVQLNVLSSVLPTSATATVSITSPWQATATTGTAASTATQLVASPPVLALAPSDITFSVTQGQPDPPGQAVTLANTGGGMLYWQAHIDSSALSWLKMSTTSGTISSGQTGQMVLYTSAAGLSAGTYKTQVLLAASDASGAQIQSGAQTIQVTFIVFQPCTLQVSPGSLQFTSSLSNPNPAGQDITVSESGNCSRPVSWTAVVDAGSRKWLVLSTTSSTDNSTLMVHVNTQGMLLGNYQGQITFSATDSNGTAIQHSSQVVSVTLTVGV